MQKNKHAKSNSASTDLPETHTALFAPLGEPAKAEYGTKSVTASKPPKEESKQPDWNDVQTFVYELDNKNLVEEYLILDECL